MKTVELKDLVGVHLLSGVDFSEVSVEGRYPNDEISVMNLVLNGSTYTFKGDREDDYRSCALEEVKVSDFVVKNRFPAVAVICQWSKDEDMSTLIFTDILTGATLVEVGTDFSEDYYPTFVTGWFPESLAVNSGV